MPRKNKNVRPIYAQIPTALAVKVEKRMVQDRRDKREILIAALEAYLCAPAVQPATAVAPELSQ